MTDGKLGHDPTLVERWLEDQREWQKTAMSYLDSMDFGINVCPELVPEPGRISDALILAVAVCIDRMGRG